jgi:putative ABC transport system permease protein
VSGDPQQQLPPRAREARTWRRYLRFFGPRGVADLDDELRFHVEMRVQDHMARGMTESEARQAVARRLGDLAAARSVCAEITTRTERRMTRTQLIDHLLQDIRFALRSLARNPGWTAVAILTLAIGIGANSAMFSVVNHLLLNPLPYPNADRVVTVFQRPLDDAPSDHLVMVLPSASLLSAWERSVPSIEAVEPFTASDVMVQRAADVPYVSQAVWVRPSFAAFAGHRPIVGRMFTDAEGRGQAAVALLDEGLWRLRFGGARDVIGATVRVNGNPVQIVGIMPAAVVMPRSVHGDVGLWMPLDTAKQGLGLHAVARLAPGVSLTASELAMDTVAARLKQGTADKATYRTSLRRPAELVSFRDSLVLLTVAVALVLLIACANVVHLLLARAATRQRELAIRAALGAGTSRLFRQLLTESMLLAVAGCAGGLAVAWAALRALVAARPAALDDLSAVRLDAFTLAVTAAIAVATGIAFGVIGALQSGRLSTSDALKAGSLAASGGRVRGRARSLLVVTEMALCTMLLIGATLLLRSVIHLQSKDLGFDPRGMYSVKPALPHERYANDAAKAAFEAELLARVRQLPGVESWTVATTAPASTNYLLGALQREGDPAPPEGTTSLISHVGASSDYFRFMGMRLVEGTTFTDTSAAAAQVIVNEGMARKLWPGSSPIGKRLRVVYAGQGDWWTVVGVVANASTTSVTGDASTPTLYGTLGGRSFFRPTLLIRATSDARFVPLLNGIVSSIDPRLPPPEVRSVEDAMNATMARPRFMLFLLGIFALVAVSLAAIGLYGVLAYSVAQRTREIGIRMALGASRGEVARSVLVQGLLMAVIGSLIGLLAARGGVKLVAHTLYGVRHDDLLSFGLGAAILTAIALIACLVPVRRAVAIDPLIAMRAE